MSVLSSIEAGNLWTRRNRGCCEFPSWSLQQAKVRNGFRLRSGAAAGAAVPWYLLHWWQIQISARFYNDTATHEATLTFLGCPLLSSRFISKLSVHIYVTSISGRYVCTNQKLFLTINKKFLFQPPKFLQPQKLCWLLIFYSLFVFQNISYNKCLCSFHALNFL